MMSLPFLQSVWNGRSLAAPDICYQVLERMPAGCARRFKGVHSDDGKCCSCTCHTPSVSMSDSSPTYSFDTTHQDMIHDAQVDYYGNHLATCSSDRTIKIWKLAEDNKPEEIAVIKGHDGPVWQVAWLHPRFAAGGMQILASCGFDGKVCFWQQTPSSQWEMLYEYRHSASVNSVSAAPHDLGCHILSASADGTISMASYSELSGGQGGKFSVQSKAGAHQIGVNAVSWAPSLAPGSLASTTPPTSFQRRFVSAGCDNLVKVWTVVGEADKWESETLQGEAKHNDWVRDVAWAPAAGLLVSLIASCSQDGDVIVWTQDGVDERGKEKWSSVLLNHFSSPVWRVSWSISGYVLAVTSGDGQVSLWKQGADGVWRNIDKINDSN